jgi:drug/metabolite transporter (DMT)-like permease
MAVSAPLSPASSSSSPFYYELLICIGTTLYGVSVVTSRAAMNNGVGPATFNSLQHIVASTSLILLRPFLKKLTANSLPNQSDAVADADAVDDADADATSKSREPLPIVKWFETRFPILKSYSFELFFLSVICASLNFIASSFNQYGLVTVEAGKSAFLTSLYVGFTPIILYLLYGSKAQISLLTWLSALVSIFGSYLLAGCDKTSLFDSLTLGEIYTILGALLWAFSILMTDYAVSRVECIDLVCIELTISTIFCLLLTILYEPNGLEPLLHYDTSADTMSSSIMDEKFLMNWSLIVATGAIEAMAFLLDTIGQIHTSGSRAALLMGLDSVVTVVVAYIFLQERLSSLESLGCLLLLSSTLLTTLGSSDEEEEGEGDGYDEEEAEAEEEEDKLLQREADHPHPAAVPKRIRAHQPRSLSSVSPVPFHRLKSSAQFAGEIRQQSYVFMSRRGLPIRTGRRGRSNSLHETSQASASSSSRRAKGHPVQTISAPSASRLSSSLPNTSSIGYGLTGDHSPNHHQTTTGQRSVDDSDAVATITPPNVTVRVTRTGQMNESSPLL